MLRRVRAKNAVIEYDLRQTARRSIECRVTDGQVIVYAPMRLPAKEADAFVLRQADWIRDALRQAGERAKAAHDRVQHNMQDGSPIPVEGKAFPLVCLPANQLSVRLDADKIIVFGAQGDAEKIRHALRSYLIERARLRFQERVHLFARKIGVRPNKITLREQKTKWGSCSSLGNLNFNWKLIMAPPQALDYVIVHELCHMIELNHSPAFWALVKKHMPEYEIWRDYLKDGIKNPFE